MEDKNISSERRIPRTLIEEVPFWLRGLLVVILVATGFGILLIALDISFGIKVSGISYPVLLKIMRAVGTVIYIGVMGYFLKGFIKKSMDKKLTFWQKIVKWNFIIFATGGIFSLIVANNWLSFSSDLTWVLSVFLLIMILSLATIIIYWLFSKDKSLFK